MAEVTLSINGRNYGIACDDGQEQRVLDLGSYVDQRMREMSKAGAATNDSQLLVLTTILLADEIFEMRDNPQAQPANAAEISAAATQAAEEKEEAVAGAIDKLAERINTIADRLQNA
ncbi:cell division protein ZapA [Alphaproteobacteria bacterium]|nr:cell division protein ZapA [Alphaproteobacteria bacterium]